MSNNFNEILAKLEECVELVGKSVESAIGDLSKSLGAEKKGTRIRIKSGSKVCIGKDTYAILESDVEAILVEGSESTPVNKENT
jgi:hypothetical protein